MASMHGGRHDAARHATAQTKKRHVGRWVALAILLVLLALAGVVGFTGFRFYQSAMRAKGHLGNVIAAAQSLGGDDMTSALENMDASISTIQSEAAAAKQETDGSLWTMAAKLPEVGGDIASVRTAIVTLDDFAQTTLPQLQTASSTLLNANLSDGQGGLNTQPIIDAASQLTAANNSLKGQAKTINALPDARIGVVQDALTKGKTQLSVVSTKVDELTGIVNMLPNFLGTNGARTYLILAQTNSEIRSSGGLIGNVGSFSADHGEIKVGEFHPNTDFHGNASDQIGENEDALYQGLYFGQYIHNISSGPDFPQVSRMAAEFWQQQSFGGSSDGVMSLDPVALQAMIEATGKVTLSDGRVLDGTTTAPFLLNGAYIELSVDQQNAYFAETATQVVDNLFKDMNSKKLMTLAKAMMSMAEQRHFYFWSFHDEDLPALRSANVTGEITNDPANPVTGLYLNEMQASKIDYYIKRNTVVQRTGTGADGSATYHVTTTFTNTMKAGQAASLPEYIIANTKDGTAMNQVTVFAPAGGSVSNVTGTGTTFSETNVYQHQVMAGTISIAPEATVTVEWDVTTAPGAAQLKFDQTPTFSSDPGIVYKQQ